MRERFLLLSVSRALISLRKFTVCAYCENVYYRFKKDAAMFENEIQPSRCPSNRRARRPALVKNRRKNTFKVPFYLLAIQKPFQKTHNRP